MGAKEDVTRFPKGGLGTTFFDHVALDVSHDYSEDWAVAHTEGYSILYSRAKMIAGA